MWKPHQESLAEDISMNWLMTFKEKAKLGVSLKEKIFEDQRRDFLEQLRKCASSGKGHRGEDLALFCVLLSTGSSSLSPSPAKHA